MRAGEASALNGEAAGVVDRAATASADRAAAQGAHAVELKTPVQKRVCASDPIDVVSGDMVMVQTDLALPGVLPLVLRRVHLEFLQWGSRYGRTWASTLDQRLELSGDGACFVAEDASVLFYPLAVAAAVGSPTMPVEGPRRWPLHRLADGRWLLTDDDSGITRRFTIPDESGVCVIDSIFDRNANSVDFHYSSRRSPFSS